MVRSFGSKDTEGIWHEQFAKAIDRKVQQAALHKLELIHTRPRRSGMNQRIRRCAVLESRLCDKVADITSLTVAGPVYATTSRGASQPVDKAF